MAEAQPQLTQHMTPDGHRDLIAEYGRLGEERTRVVKAVADAAAEGDRSENAEYIYGKRRMREIDKKMRILKQALDAAVVVDPKADRGDRVFFGATVVLADDDGATVTYQLVGEHETDAAAGKISYRSPVGAALMRKHLDDEVRVKTPGGLRTLVVVEIQYR